MNAKTYKNITSLYRFSFQSQEGDPEIKGVGNSINYKYRMHDPRIGRFFAVDPLASEYSYNSPYAFSENKVIAWGELEGLECYYAADGTTYIGQIGSSTELRTLNNAEAETHVKNALYKQNHGLTEKKKQWYQYDLKQAYKNSKGYYEDKGPTQAPNVDNVIDPKAKNEDGAERASNLLGKASLGTESVINLKDVEAPNSRSFLKGVGVATTIVEGAAIVEDAYETGDYKKAGVESAALIFETAVVDQMITKPNPYSIGLGLAYYLVKAVITPCPDRGSVPLPENWDQLRDQDNTRTNGSGGGF